MSGNLLSASCQKHHYLKHEEEASSLIPMFFVSKINDSETCQVMNDIPHVRKSTKNDMQKSVYRFRIPACLGHGYLMVISATHDAKDRRSRIFCFSIINTESGLGQLRSADDHKKSN